MTNTSFNLQNGIFLPFSPEATGVGIPGQLAVWSTDNKIGPATVAQVKASLGIEVWVTDPQFGADRTGATDSTSAINNAIAAAQTLALTQGLVVVVFPAGMYKISGTLQVSASNILLRGEARDRVMIKRSTDFGPALQFSSAAGLIQTVGVENIQVADTAAVSNTAGYSTVTNSPYQIIFDGCQNVYVNNVNVLSGAGMLALRGVTTAWVIDPILTNAGTAELGSTGTGLYIGSSSNANLVTKYCSGVWLTDMEMECNSKIADGLRVDGCDGLWMSSPHVQGTLNADFRLSHSGSFPMANIFATNLMADICAGNGVLCDGTKRIVNSKIEGLLIASGSGGANKAGFLMSGTGGCNNFLLDASVVGWGGPGISFTSGNTTNVAIRPRQVNGNNLSAGSFPAIDLNCSVGINFSITGGIVGAGTAEVNNIHIGGGMSRITIVGVLASSSTGYGIVIDSGVSHIAIAGCDLSSNALGAILDNSGITSKRFVGNLDGNEVYADGTVSLQGNGKLQTRASDTSSAYVNIPSGTAPTSPVNGDFWQDGTNLKFRIGGVTKTVTLT